MKWLLLFAAIVLLLDPLAFVVFVGVALVITGLGMLVEAYFRRNDRRSR